MKLTEYAVALHLLLGMIFTGASSTGPADGAADDDFWSAMNIGDFAGTNGPVYAQVWHDGYLYAGGAFTIAGNIPCNNIARWDGSRWDSLGPGTDSAIMAIAFDSSGNLYAGGVFLHAGAIPVNQIARWDGSEWSALGSGPNTIKGHYRDYASWISSIAVDHDGSVYVGGQYEKINDIVLNNIAKWDGATWSVLGSGVQASRTVAALIIDTRGDLIVGGSFDSAGGIEAHCVAKWNGSFWDSLGLPLRVGENGPHVSSLVFDNGGNLYAGGNFSFSGNVSSKNIAKWDGTAWTPLDRGMDAVSYGRANVAALAVDSNGRLYAGGQFRYIPGDTLANNIVMWDGVRWSSLEHGFDEPFAYDKLVASLAFDDRGRLYAGGCFKSVQGKTANNITLWNGNEWNTLGVGIAGPVKDTVLAILPAPEGIVFCGGTFKGGVAKWDGTNWNITGQGIKGRVAALCLDSSGLLYAAGLFDSAGTHGAKNIARWDGSEWTGLDLGLSPGPVCAITCDARGNLYAGGSFSKAGGVPVKYVAKWDGSRWDSLGLSLGGKYAPSVASLAFDKNGNLFVGGNFNELAPYYYCRNIVVWNGTVWDSVAGTSVGSYDDVINSIVFDRNGTLFWINKAGYFPNGEQTEKKRSSVWALHENRARELGRFNGYASAMAADDSGTIYVAGCFSSVMNADDDSLGVNGIARWNSADWKALGTGLRHYGNALAVRDTTLFAGGPFGMAGNACSPFIAKGDIRHIPAEAIRRPPVSSKNARYRYVGRVLRISGVAPRDRVELYLLSGKVIRRTFGASSLNLDNIPPQTVMFRVVRGSGMIMQGVVIVAP